MPIFTDLRPRFTLDDARRAGDEWGFNCGPAALCAILDMTPEEIRPHMGDFEGKGYTNPTLMASVLRDLRRPFRRICEYTTRKPAAGMVQWPEWGLVRIQWEGPWTEPGVPVRARYRHTHWVGCQNIFGKRRRVFDVNAMCVDGWLSFREWADELVPWLLRECEPKSNGCWWPTHSWEVQRDK